MTPNDPAPVPHLNLRAFDDRTEGKPAARWFPGAAATAALAFVLAGVLAGCSANPPIHLPDGAVRAHELDTTPFFAQDDNQCGPAALATILQSSGVGVEPGQLTREIYVPGRRGSLQLELVGATRRHERVPYRLDPHLDALVSEVQQGHPVLVLQNLGVRWLPVWHYAVVIGFSREDDSVVLRSGRTRRLVVDVADFDAAWARGNRWALIALRPGELPAILDAERYLNAAIDLERTGKLATARAAYHTLLERQPQNQGALFGFASVSQRLGELGDAEAAYRRILVEHPTEPLVLNNLALVLTARGCIAQAQSNIAAALRALPADHRQRPALEDTAAQVEAAAERNEPDSCTSGAIAPRSAD